MSTTCFEKIILGQSFVFTGDKSVKVEVKGIPYEVHVVFVKTSPNTASAQIFVKNIIIQVAGDIEVMPVA